MSYDVESFGISDLGLVRENNEDVFHEIPMHRFFALADGMGGHNAGEVAAKEAVYHLASSVCQLFSMDEKNEPLQDLLHKAIVSANKWVHELSEQKKELSGMGTTLCCLLLDKDSLIYAHVGDSRIYRFRDDLVQITEDHASLNTKKPFPSKLGITRCIGTSPHVEPAINVDPVLPGDIYFLCSDGLTDHVSDKEMTQILQKHTCIQSASKEMIEKAKIKGGTDNITILMIRILLNDSSHLP